MSKVIDDIKGLYDFKYKKRDDDFSDQYSRIFMFKALIIAASLTGLEWYSDEITCQIPKLAGDAMVKQAFPGKACWINGFYVYDELRLTKGCAGYFGLPMNVDHNGTIVSHGHAQCQTCVSQGNSMDCKPMTKRFYIQYQWFPFFLAAIAILYYAPYFLFHIANDDLKSLKTEIKKLKPDIQMIVATYFDTENRTLMQKQKQNIMLNVIIKFGYALGSIFAFAACDASLNGDFKNFGLKWLQWTKIPEHDNYVDRRAFIDAADQILPTFGFCDVLEEGLDIKHSVVNEHRLICEISQHILYQYILMMLWFIMVIGIIVSVGGFVMFLLSLVRLNFFPTNDERKNKADIVVTKLPLRQLQYLRFVRKKNEIFYGEIVKCLYDKMRDKVHFGDESML